MARFTQPTTGDGSGLPGPQGDPGAPGVDGLDSLFLGTWNSVTEFLAAYQGGPVGLADGDWWAFVKDNTDPNKIYVVREDPNSATGWVIDDNEHFDLPQGPQGDPGADGADGSDGAQGDPGLPGADGADALWNYTGEYNGGASYAVGDIATYDGQLWYRYNSNGGNVGDTPSPGLWNLLAAKGADGADGATGSQGLYYLGNYVSGNGYVANLAVVKGSDNNLYIATSSGGLGDPVGNTAEWSIFLPKGADGAQGDPGIQGDPGSDAPTDRIYSGDFQAIIDSTGTTTFDGNVIPSANTYSLGTAESPWKDIYVTAGSINIADNDIEVDGVSIKNTEGYLVISRGGLEVTDNTDTHKIFQLNPDGTLILKSDVVESPTSAALEIVGSLTGTSISPENTGVLLHLTGLRNSPSRIYNDSYGANVYSAYIGRHARGTADDPEGLLAGDIISRIGGNSFLSSNTFASISNVRMDFVTKENQTNTARGNEIQFWTTPIGQTAPTLSFTLDNSGIKFPDNTTQTTAAVEQIQSDWTQTDNSELDYIKNKPTLPDLSGYGVPTSYNPVWSGTGLTYTGTPATGSYMKMGKMVTFRIKVDCATVAGASNSGFGSGQYSLTLPFQPVTDYIFRDGGIHHINGPAHYQMSGDAEAGTTQLTLWYTASQGQDQAMDYNSPHALQTPDHFYISGTYECV